MLQEAAVRAATAGPHLKEEQAEKEGPKAAAATSSADGGGGRILLRRTQQTHSLRKPAYRSSEVSSSRARTPYRPPNLYNMSTSVLPLPSHMAGFLHELGAPSSGVYSFVSYPSALLLPNRPKYRNEQQSGPVNIMHDRRVVRGNTYAHHGSTGQVNPTDDELIRQRQIERKTYVKRRVLPNISNRLALSNSAGSSTTSKRFVNENKTWHQQLQSL